MSQHTPSRRTVVRTAAWAVPAVTLVTAAPAFAASQGEVTYQEVNRTFVFHPTVLGSVSTDPNHEVIVSVTATVPLVIPAGMTANPTSTISSVTIPQSLTSLLGPLMLGNPAQVGGTSTSTTTLSGALTGDSVTELTIDRTPFSSSQPLVTIARGSGTVGVTAPAGSSGVVTLTLQPPVSTLIGYNASGAETKRYDSTLAAKAGVDYTLGTFTIG